MNRRLKVLLFATAREAVGRPRIDVEIPKSGSTVRQVVVLLARDYPRLAGILTSCRFTRNGEYVQGWSARVRPGDEFAIHPPYSGG
ncbi:MAG: MoaD/ThiS family protein [Thermoplasmata archaeon]